MGAPCDMLVVASTLYENPEGLTKNELVNIFQNKLHLKKSFQGVYPELKFGDYGFARIFNLEHTQEYLQNRKKYFNENYNYCSKQEIIWPEFPLRVIHRDHKNIAKGYIIKNSFDSQDFGVRLFEGYKVGQYIHNDSFDELKIPQKYNSPNYSYLVRDVIATKIKDTLDEKSQDFSREINQKLFIEVVEFKNKEYIFKSLDNLMRKYPEYAPEKIFNFNQETGLLYPYPEYGHSRDFGHFTWIKKGDKYFLDLDVLHKILSPNSFYEDSSWIHQENKKSPYSLTDLVLTSEAIRRRNWNIFGYNYWRNEGQRNFAYTNEKTLRRYEQAVLDTEVSMNAQKKEMTNFEFLREHLFETASFVRTPFPEIKRMLKEQNKKYGIAKRKWTIQKKKEKPPIELPF
jgi:hypothetical protein